MELDFSKVKRLRQPSSSPPKNGLSERQTSSSKAYSAAGARQEVKNFLPPNNETLSSLPPVMQEYVNELSAFCGRHTPLQDDIEFWDGVMKDAARTADRHKGDKLFQDMLLALIGELEKKQALSAESFGGRMLTEKEARVADALIA